MPWIHLPTVAWGVAIELVGWVCPLTPLENRLRRAAGGAGYEGGCIEHYLTPLIYPVEYTRELALGLGLGLLCVNVGVYALVAWRRRRTPEA